MYDERAVKSLRPSTPYANQTAAPETDRVLLLDAISQRVGDTNGTLGAHIEGMSQLLDSLLGSEPKPGASTTGIAAPSGGRAYGLGQATSYTQDLLGMLASQIERLRAL